MKIMTRVNIVVVVTLGVFLVYGAAILHLDQVIHRLIYQAQKANEFANKINLLRTLTQDYLLHRTERAQKQWSAIYADVLEKLNDPDFQALQGERGFRDAAAKMKIVGNTFEGLMIIEPAAPDNPAAPAAGELQNRLSTQLLLATQDLLTRFVNLNERVNRELIRTQHLASLFDILALLSLGLIILSIGVFLQRSVLKPILKLYDGAEIVGAGNLDYKVGSTSPDEVGELSRAFDRMTTSLQQLTVSRDELLREMVERQQAEEALRQSEERLRLATQAGRMFAFEWHPVTDEVIRSAEAGPILGLSGAAAIHDTGQGFFAKILAEDQQDFIRVLQNLNPEMDRYTADYRLVKSDTGQVIWLEEIARAIFAGGKLQRLYGMTVDITDRKQAEEALRESEARFRKVFEHAATGIAITDWQGRFQQCNPAYCTLLGYTQEELRQLEFAALIHPEDRDKNLKNIQRLRAGELPFFEIENRYLRKECQTVWVHKFVSILPDSTGKPAHIMALVTDVTERRRTQAELAETLRQKEEALALSERLASFPQLNPNPVVEFNAPERITYANPAAEKFLEPLAPNISLRDFLPADWEAIQQANRERGENTFQREVRIKDRVFHEAMHFSESLKVWRIYAIDISQRHMAEEALRESEARFRSLFENMAEGVVIHELISDEDGRAMDYRILSANPALENHTGLRAADLEGQLASRAFGLDEAPYLEVFARVAQTGEPTTFETFFPPLQRYFHISVTSPKKDYFVTVFEDITARRQMEERLRTQTSELSQAVSDLEDTNAELERFMYMISHDLKSPLVTIATFLGFLEEDLERRDAGRIDKDLLYIRTAADKMGQLLHELLEMSRIGRVVNPPVEVSFQEVAQEALQAVAGPIAGRGVTVQVGEEDVTLFGDRPRLVEIWQNLLENAVKYLGEQPAPRLAIGLEQQGEATVFFVCDNGIGIEPRYQDKIFGIFEKLDPKSGGTGIGLAIVKRIVELYRGKIWVESAGLGHGACFRFTLPGAIRRVTSAIENSD